MRQHCRLHRLGIPRFQRRDVPQMFANRGLVAVPLKLFVPLIMVVENQRDHLLDVYKRQELIRFILNAQSAGLRLVLVITGKGKRGQDIGPIPQRMGALRHQVPQWLRLPPLGPAVLQISEAHLKHGGSGAYYVYLRRR